MTNIYIKAKGSTLVATCDGKITSGTVGLPVVIEYDDEWRGLLKNISFRAGGIVRVRKNVANETTVPWEILRKSGIPLEIGIEGRNEDGSIVFPTVWYSVGRILEGASGKIPAAPNPNSGEDIGGNSSINDDIISKSFVWSSKNTVDKLCPSIDESGSVVQCTPLEGYPLGVVSVYSGEEPGLLALYHGGKNLFDDVAWFESNGFTKQSDGSWQAKQVNKTCWINTTKKKGTMYLTAIAKTDATAYDPVPCYFVMYYTDGTYDVSFVVKDTNGFATLTSETNPNKTVDYIIWTFGGAGDYYVKGVSISFVDNEYEPYREGQTFTVDLTNAPFDGGPNTYDWETGLLFNAEGGQYYQHDLEAGEFIGTGFWEGDDLSEYPVKKIRSFPALSGVNCLYSYTDKAENTCTTTVSGKSDPNAVIKDLYNKLNALSATMVALTGV